MEGTAVPREAGLPDAHGLTEAPGPLGGVTGVGPDGGVWSGLLTVASREAYQVPSVHTGQLMNIPLHFPLIPPGNFCSILLQSGMVSRLTHAGAIR